ncbi:MAG: hypothetical protein UU81_C0047G0005 [Microgenomates group bacterium GW2011_GWC1_41_8]|uniref:Pyridoxal-5'-phosphate-dependent protein n=5 Tax=Candidatus Giovannoniibacteriota TaxID=1752738 RepID=A0A1F5WXQ6_9BACT|nr:MAG: hypothetical protein UU81_C0047G0005 [Microgenomates group bacterium GW2011_GWC1_41_8]KKT74471.1 MAG: hypothetical protein UW71_C0022G0008 [Parcubacteria group bacterium GW2011_GWB1_44_7]KKT78346.1 MAG: hypothetical protein UW74_C0024G0002 [Candidatus Giovannonibacteria bacterium GW2011_GWC2_44_8]OGF73984.1 MAG: hypothetical protein A2W57_02650 [Candidatus Giovannonibacteria bacterium RIFCSPHIGHO2_02_43_16]OGF80432.1 MAG: hypothetical protein A2W48_00690 [Candidatus Giovannonibacteria b
MNRKIPLFKVHMPKTVLGPLGKVLMSGYISEGDKSHEFEKNFQEFIGNPNVALVNSGTSALSLAYRLAGIGPGDEVISTPMTCLATNEPIMTSGAKIIWADIDKNTGNIDTKSLEGRITPKTKAIVVVHWAGNPVDLGAVTKIAKKHNLKVIEDAAHALGAKYDGKYIGNHSDYVCFSFQAIKHLTTVDGGAVAVKTPEEYQRAILLRWYGNARSSTSDPIKWSGDVLEPGYKMHMNDVNATIGLEQLKYMPKIIAMYKKNAAYLLEGLEGIKEITLPQTTVNGESSFWLFTIKLPGEDYRQRFSEALRARGIANGIVHSRNDAYSLFKSWKRSDLPGVDDFCSRMLNIPCGWWLSKSDVSYIIKNIKEVVKEI